MVPTLARRAARFTGLTLLWLLASGAPAAQPAPDRFDLIIRNGRVYDGNGNPWIRADVGIVGDRIRAVGRLAGVDGGSRRSMRRVWPSRPGSSTCTRMPGPGSRPSS